MAKRRFVLGVDLDGVVADFYRGLRPIAAEWLGVDVAQLTDEVSYGLPEWNLDSMGGYQPLHRFAVTQRQLFEKLEPIDGAVASLRRLSERQVRIRIITHRLFINFFHEKAASQTIIWLERYGIPYSDLCLMEDKTAVGAHIYIEDSPKNVERLRELDQEVIISPIRRIEIWRGCAQILGRKWKSWLRSGRIVISRMIRKAWANDGKR